MHMPDYSRNVRAEVKLEQERSPVCVLCKNIAASSSFVCVRFFFFAVQ